MAIKSVFFLLLCFTFQNCEKERDWVEIDVPSGKGCLGNVIWTDKQFAVLEDFDHNQRSILTSPDGINWTRNEIAFSASGAGKLYNQELKWLNNQYVVLVPIKDMNYFKAYIATSKDGLNWTEIPTTEHTKRFSNIVWNDNLYFAVGNQGSISTSKDLINWTNYDLPETSWQLQNIYYVNGIFFASCFNCGNVVMTMSKDGFSWYNIDLFTDGYRLTFDNGRYIAHGSGGIYESADAKTWTSRMILGPNLYDLTWGFNDYVGLNSRGNGSLEIWSSKDLSIWRQYEYKPAYNFPESILGWDRYFTGVAHNGERYVITGYEVIDSNCIGGFILTSQ